MLLLVLIIPVSGGNRKHTIENVMGRERQSLNGRWYVITDVMDMGENSKWYAPKTVNDLNNLSELSYEGGMTMQVPGDWNHQYDEFVYYEAPLWYKRNFVFEGDAAQRDYILHFGAVANSAKVYLNGKLLGTHSGGFTPFEFDVTDKLNQGDNYVIVKVDNRRTKSTIPAMSFDWWNYGGITRDVDLVSVPKSYISNYWVRLVKGSLTDIEIDVNLSLATAKAEKVDVKLTPNSTHSSAKTISCTIKCDENGNGYKLLSVKDLALWSPEDPHLYNLIVQSSTDKVEDQVGLRSFEVKGSEMLLNGEPVFMRGINIHEEIASERRRSIDEQDAEYLTNQALELGCNFIRLSHYPHNEYMVRMCERKGLMMWEEIPTWQKIDFEDPKVCENAKQQMWEMIERDKNRCGIVIWSIANETWNLPSRNKFLCAFADTVRTWDNTRAVSSALDGLKYVDDEQPMLVLDDPLEEHLDVVGLNKYMGWYQNWRVAPEQTKWIVKTDKPIIVSEFGAEAIYGNYGDGKNINSWSEDYMKAAYDKNLALFKTLKNFRGCSPWILFDFRSPRRSHATFQQGWNRKGLLSPRGEKKQAWYVMRDFYESKK